MAQHTSRITYVVPKYHNDLIKSYCAAIGVDKEVYLQTTANNCLEKFDKEKQSNFVDMFNNLVLSKSVSDDIYSIFEEAMKFYGAIKSDCLRFGLYELIYNPVLTPRFKELVAIANTPPRSIGCNVAAIPKYVVEHIANMQKCNSFYGIILGDIVPLAVAKFVELYEKDKVIGNYTRFFPENEDILVKVKVYKDIHKMSKYYGNIQRCGIIRNMALYSVIMDGNKKEEVIPMKEEAIVTPPVKEKNVIISSGVKFDNPKVKDVFTHLLRNTDVGEMYISEAEADFIITVICNMIGGKYTEEELVDFANV